MAIIWNELRPNGSANFNWYRTCVSADGTKMIAGIYTGRLWVSTNSGSSWSEVQPAGAADKAWDTVLISDDGQVMVAAVYGGRLYQSTNGGTNWTEKTPAGSADKYWQGGFMSTDGSVWGMQVEGASIWITSNTGTSFTERKPSGSTSNFINIACSTDGSKIFGGTNGGRLWYSTDTGATWNEKRPNGDANFNWYGAGCSGDGTILYAAAYGGRIWKSTNSGTNWSEIRPKGDVNANWINIRCNGDGTIVNATDAVRNYCSVDSGANWTEEKPAGNVDLVWTWGWVSRTANIILDPIYGGRLLSGSTTGTISTSVIYPSVDAYITAGNATFSTLRSLTAGDSVTDNTQLHIACDKPSGYEIKRDVLIFDTSSIADNAIISSVKFYFYRTDSGNTMGDNQLAIQGASPASDTSIVVGDWDCMTINTPTEFATRLNFSSLGTIGWYYFTFNSDGISAISKTGNTRFAIREGKHDIDNSAPTGVGNYLIYDSSSVSGGATKPYLEIVYSVTSIKTIDGLAKASVKTIDGLAIASVKTWDGLN